MLLFLLQKSLVGPLELILLLKLALETSNSSIVHRSAVLEQIKGLGEHLRQAGVLLFHLGATLLRGLESQFGSTELLAKRLVLFREVDCGCGVVGGDLGGFGSCNGEGGAYGAAPIDPLPLILSSLFVIGLLGLRLEVEQSELGELGELGRR
jgi:hypothetical protein